MPKKMHQVGIASKGYSTQRFITNKIAGYHYVDIRFYNQYLWRNLHLLIARKFKLLKLSEEDMLLRLFLKYKLIFPSFFNFQVLHFFNTVNFSKRTPWVLTIETCLPYTREIINCLESERPDLSVIRNDPQAKKVLYQLSLDNCRGMLAFSECTRQIQQTVIDCFPEYKERLEKKLITLHPPQKLIVKTVEEKGVSYDEKQPLRFIFIGRDFFRKGGKQVLDAFEQYKQQYRFELILISDLSPGKDKFAFFTEEDRANCLNYINANKDWISYYPSLPNQEVMNLIKKSHVALLPTWMDTYGYSVLECQASGCPVITTDLRALTEINNDEVGWLISVPVNHLKYPVYQDPDAFNFFDRKLSEGLLTALKSVFDDRNAIRDKAAKCLERIKTNHDPEAYAEVLQAVYDGKQFI
jgi:glycosyltransferase involved in cell wall biosynthesis